MNENQIIEQVAYEINRWQIFMERRNFYTKLSPRAEQFIVELIRNIEDDPSPYWRINTSTEAIQSIAISRIPEALEMITRQKRVFFHKEVYISSWELWNSLSNILIKFCFIPEKDM